MLDNPINSAAFKGNLNTSGQGSADSEFGFALSNASSQPTTVTISRWSGSAAQVVKSVTLPGREDAATRGVALVRLPWAQLGNPNTDGLGASGRARLAYRLSSTHPITVYQFNPMSAVARIGACTTVSQCNLAGSGGGQTCVANVCNYPAASNDATLVLPTHALGTSYVGLSPEHLVSRPTASGAPTSMTNGSLTLVGTQDDTLVTVKAAAKTRAGDAGVSALSAGETRTFTLAAFEVLQLSTDIPAGVVSGSTAGNLQCANSPYDTSVNCGMGICAQLCRVALGDLTGSFVSSDKPLAVFGGSACSVRGYTDVACDHLEEQLPPFRAWGKTFVATRSAPLRLANNGWASPTDAAPDYYKVVAGCPASECPSGTLLTLSAPPSASDIYPNADGCMAGTSLSANTCRLRGGAFVEFRSKVSFTLTADQPVQVAQFFAGHSATYGFGATTPVEGDPSMLLVPPVEQWGSEATVVTPADFRSNYLSLAIDSTQAAEVRVDGSVVPVTVAVGSTKYRMVILGIAPGTHTVAATPLAGQATATVGVTVYGFERSASYGYAAGQTLRTLVAGSSPGN